MYSLTEGPAFSPEEGEHEDEGLDDANRVSFHKSTVAIASDGVIHINEQEEKEGGGGGTKSHPT